MEARDPYKIVPMRWRPTQVAVTRSSEERVIVLASLQGKRGTEAASSEGNSIYQQQA